MRLGAPCFAFASSFLLFLVQPLLARRLLPVLGGSPSVWTACLLAFQTLLLCGYGTAHMLARRPSRQAATVHLALLALGAAGTLHLGVVAAPAPGASPLLHALLALLLAGGLPFLALSTTTPLLHRRWIEADPAAPAYRLVAAGNAGSMLALALGPLLLDRVLDLTDQFRIWQVAYVLLALGIAWLWWPWPRRNEAALQPDGGGTPRPPARVVGGWIFLAFVPSALLAAYTLHVTSELAPIPLLWTLPLALYLASWIVVFVPAAAAVDRVARVAIVPAASLSACLLLLEHSSHWMWQAAAHMLCLFVASVVLHGRLVARRPAVAEGSAWYLALAVGGAAGGFFASVVAPALFNDLYELPLLLFVASAIGAWPTRAASTLLARAFPLVALLPFALLEGARATWDADGWVLGCWAAALVAPLLVVVRQPRAAVAALGALLLLPFLLVRLDFMLRWQERTFFGVHKILDVPATEASGAHRRLLHGGTIHGVAMLLPEPSSEPTTYYARSGPLGAVFAAARAGDEPQRVAVVGLGAGTIAAYAQPGWRMDFYEIDPVVVRLARDPRWFTFVSSAHEADLRFIVADGRLGLAAAPAHAYDTIVLDAFSGNGVPVHLLAREAMALYATRLRDGGVMAFHVSSWHVDLVPVVAASARDLGLPAREARYGGSEWIVVAARPGDPLVQFAPPDWQDVSRRALARSWTDERANLLEVLE